MKSVNDFLVDPNRQAIYLSRGSKILGNYIKFPRGVKGAFDSINREQRRQILRLRFMVAGTIMAEAAFFDIDHEDKER